MIGKLTGQFQGMAQENQLLIDVSGVGYIVRVAPGTAAECPPHGSPISLFIHTAVREDAIDLYGFPTMQELSFFKLLTSVSGVGPKTALGILTVADVPSLSRAVAHGDASVLTKVYGIGKKSAERIVVELRDKLAKSQEMEGVAAEFQGAGADSDVLAALEGLGYSASESRAAVRSVPKTVTGVRERLALALKNLGTPASL
jgi:holliday junction DNA helicase RuvA